MIVEVALSFGHPETATEDRCCKIFRARLAIASGDRQDSNGKRFPVVRGNGLVSLQSVFDANDREVVWNLSLPAKIDNRARGAGFHSGFDEFVSIEIFPAQGDEQFAAL